MLRQIMTPSKENSTISIPAEYYGKEVEILVFPFHKMKTVQNTGNIKEIFDRYMFSFGSYKFNRNEANNYE